MHARHSEEYFAALTTADVRAGTRVVVELHREGATTRSIVTDLLAPAQKRVGERWEQGAWSVADEHAATAVTDTALSVLVSLSQQRQHPHAPHVAVVCAEGEWHDLSARMAAAIASEAGARVTMLGASMPADQLSRRLEGDAVDVLALSCTMPTNLLGAARCVAAAHEAGVPVLAGGQAFGSDPQRALGIGADGWAASADGLVTTELGLLDLATDVPTELMHVEAVDGTTLAPAYARLLDSHPVLATQPPWQQRALLEEMTRMCKVSAAAVLTGDQALLDEHVIWLSRVRFAGASAPAVGTAVRLVASTVEADAPRCAAALRQAMGALDSAAAGLDV